MAFCTKCGKPIEGGVAFCSGCGSPVAASAGAPVTSSPAKTDKLKPIWYVIIWCSLLVPFFGGLIIVVLSSVMHYVWRKDFPKKAKEINAQGFGAFFAGLALGLFLLVVVPNFVRMQNRARESDVRAVAHTLQLMIEDYKTTPVGSEPHGGAGLKPSTCSEFFYVASKFMPDNIQEKVNPFNRTQLYGIQKCGEGDFNISSTLVPPRALVEYGGKRRDLVDGKYVENEYYIDLTFAPNLKKALGASLKDTLRVGVNLGAGITFGSPENPGQVGYIFTGQREPYRIIALGKDGTPILILQEGS